ncbi:MULTISPECIES: hypothetical protein [Amycolatopsis]|uniref:hypothetical protein n=1 Tax=Amycolatopsis TaxID=1813 RepID=UPI00339F683E
MNNAQKARWIVGTLLFVQGFGSAVTDALWNTTFGVAGLLRAAGLPGWFDHVAGTVGAILLIWALTRTSRATGRA